MISIIVPIYNVSNFLPLCVESILNQTFSEIEIILVDDGSTDGCYEICEEYRQKDSRIRVIHKENGGLVSARKVGLRTASGEYIAYVDGDDWIETDMYERMYQKLIEEKVDIVIGGHYEDTGCVRKEVFHGAAEGRYGKEELLSIIYPQMLSRGAFFDCAILPMICGKLFRRECIERFLMAVDEQITMGEDAACTCPSLLNAESIYIVKKCLYHYRQSTSSMIKNVPNPGLERMRFQVLYKTGRESLKKYRYIYDLTEQWDTFVISLMLPRADGLYDGFEKLPYLFPFPHAQKGARIVLYGAGTYGQRLYRYLEDTGFCQVTAWVDRNYVQYQNMGLPVENPETLAGRPDTEYDTIVIAIIFSGPRLALYRELVQKYPKEKICLPDERLIFSQESRQAFGLI